MMQPGARLGGARRLVCGWPSPRVRVPGRLALQRAAERRHASTRELDRPDDEAVARACRRRATTTSAPTRRRARRPTATAAATGVEFVSDGGAVIGVGDDTNHDGRDRPVPEARPRRRHVEETRDTNFDGVLDLRSATTPINDRKARQGHPARGTSERRAAAAPHRRSRRVRGRSPEGSKRHPRGAVCTGAAWAVRSPRAHPRARGNARCRDVGVSFA